MDGGVFVVQLLPAALGLLLAGAASTSSAAPVWLDVAGEVGRSSSAVPPPVGRAVDAQLGPGMGRPPRDTESCIWLFNRLASYYEEIMEIWDCVMICIAQSLVRVVSPRELTPTCRGWHLRI